MSRRAAHPKGWETITCFAYGQRVTKTIKTLLATYRPAGGLIRGVIVKEKHEPEYFSCADPEAKPAEIIGAFADRSAIEQNHRDFKEVWGGGQQQVRNIWTNVAAFNLNLWTHTLVECWAWDKDSSAICDRTTSPWDDPDRRPSHADRRKASPGDLAKRFSDAFPVAPQILENPLPLRSPPGTQPITICFSRKVQYNADRSAADPGLNSCSVAQSGRRPI